MVPPSVYEDFAEMGRGALVDYLALRGLSTSARKIKLVALAYSAFELPFTCNQMGTGT